MVTTAKQIRANRKNAKKGGVKTKQGKEKSKMNALKHGILTEATILPGEDVEVLVDIMFDLHAELQPQGQLEETLVDRIISCTWRLQRVNRAETTQILRHYREHMPNMSDYPTSIVKRHAENSFFNSSNIDNFLRYETAIERQLYKALNTLIEIRLLRAKYRDVGITTSEPQKIRNKLQNEPKVDIM